MKLNKKLAAALLALPLMMGSFSTLAAHHKSPPPKGMPLKVMLKGIDLTTEQKNQIDTIRQAAKAQKNAQRQAHQQASTAIVTAPTFNEADAQKLAQDMTAQKAKSKVEMLRNQQQIFSILTPEQQAKAKANIENFKLKKQGKMQGKGKGQY